MKYTLILMVCTLVFGLQNNAFSQEKETKKITKEVQLEKVNDKTVLTVITTDNGVVTKEIFHDEAAERKLKELENTEPKRLISEENVTEEILIDENDGVRTLKIIRTDNGVETVEIYEGQEADRKIAELKGRKEEKKVIKRESSHSIEMTNQ